MHVREQIAQRFDALLAGITDFADTSGPRTRDIPEERLPAATVFSVRETSTVDHQVDGTTVAYRREAEFLVVIHLAAGALRTNFNALCVPVETAILADPKQSGLARGTVLSGTEFGIDPQTSKPLGFGFVRFLVIYVTSSANPENPL
ncbi:MULTISPECIES: hypothetical protein [unclassified Mesorhizobium]|uniref:hypothetical protein n=1 Tax=unclassified Mesorhizobium TaxID=325217 RepID=UPI001129C097|nr:MULTISPECIES: hypothetical protein [unclassified Mesorhizobium]MCA0027338.1 hypothetical protein [Mesorhizobium sp. B263B1A]TPJ98613.1 hypothetical protein FJ489_06710 [Mesorhizobium sp. B2-5-12]TPK28775.1 hypothetical protein FJ562_00100 [Mesorhizobium sp. B2-5-6]